MEEGEGEDGRRRRGTQRKEIGTQKKEKGKTEEGEGEGEDGAKRSRRRGWRGRSGEE